MVYCAGKFIENFSFVLQKVSIFFIFFFTKSFFIKAIDHTFYGFTGVITNLECWLFQVFWCCYCNENKHKIIISSCGNSNTAQSNTKRNDQQAKKVMSVKQLILLVSVTGFVSTPVWRVCTLISRFKGFTLGSLSKDVSERRTSTGSEAFSIFICLETTKFVLLSFFSPMTVSYTHLTLPTNREV